METLTFDTIAVGTSASFTHTLSHKDVEAFSKLVGDTNPLHVSEPYASTTPFKKPIAHGMLVNGLLSTLAGMHLPGQHSLILSVESYFKHPCYPGEKLVVSGEVVEKIPSGKILVLKTRITSGEKELLSGKMRVQVLA